MAISAIKKAVQVRSVLSYRTVWSDNLTRLIHAAGREAERNAVAREALGSAIRLAFEARSESMCGNHGSALQIAYDAVECLKGLHGECGRIRAGLEKYASIQNEAYTATQGIVKRETAKVNQAAVELRKDLEAGRVLRGVLAVRSENELFSMSVDQPVTIRLARAS